MKEDTATLPVSGVSLNTEGVLKQKNADRLKSEQSAGLSANCYSYQTYVTLFF